jgi:hypothetical protein
MPRNVFKIEGVVLHTVLNIYSGLCFKFLMLPKQLNYSHFPLTGPALGEKCYFQCCGAGAARSRIFWSEPEP